MGQLIQLDTTGDTKIVWDKSKPDETAVAKAAFDKLHGDKKYLAYSVKGNGEKGEVLTAFDPSAEKIILAPPMVGG